MARRMMDDNTFAEILALLTDHFEVEQDGWFCTYHRDLRGCHNPLDCDLVPRFAIKRWRAQETDPDEYQPKHLAGDEPMHFELSREQAEEIRRGTGVDMLAFHSPFKIVDTAEHPSPVVVAKCEHCGYPIEQVEDEWVHFVTFDGRRGARACEPDMQSMSAEPAKVKAWEPISREDLRGL